MEQFRDYSRDLLETEEESIIVSGHRPTTTKHNRSTIDGEASRELMTKLEDCKFHKSSNNYMLSPWPPVRLYY